MPKGDLTFNGRYQTSFCTSCQAGAHFCKGTTLSQKPCECPNTLCQLERSESKKKKALGITMHVTGKLGAGIGRGLWHLTDPPKAKERRFQEKLAEIKARSQEPEIIEVPVKTATDDAIKILRERYAKGEINKEQFDEMSKDLA